MSMSQNRFHRPEVLAATTRLTERQASTLSSTADQEANRLWWAFALARYTAARREELGLTVGEAAELSGLEISEWLGLEQGWVPQDQEMLKGIAGALRVRWTDYSTVALLSECHQQCR